MKSSPPGNTSSDQRGREFALSSGRGGPIWQAGWGMKYNQSKSIEHKSLAAPYFFQVRSPRQTSRDTLYCTPIFILVGPNLLGLLIYPALSELAKNKGWPMTYALYSYSKGSPLPIYIRPGTNGRDPSQQLGAKYPLSFSPTLIRPSPDAKSPPATPFHYP